ncbi:hypothetical protein WJU16_23205 [Chitinophaga pollutisoli]|uniref:ZU5 domain-containing protein n=1 Tax=Chitinophaga pollutisoli TaxID=3133966 RepID=A0ABZ2YMD8_9BACT
MKYYVLCAFGLLSLFACSKKSKKDQPEPDKPAVVTGKPFTTAKGAVAGQVAWAVIGAAGGSLQSTDLNVSLTVPSGAVAEDRTFRIQAVSNTLRPDKPLLAYRILPDDVNFTKPVTVTIKYNPEDLTPGAEDMLMLAYQDANGTWKPMATKLDKTNHTVTATMTHFCDIAFYEVYELFAAKTEIAAGQEVSLRCGVQEISPNQDSLLAPLQHPVDDAGFGRPATSQYAMLHGKYAGSISGWKVLNGPGTVTAARNPHGLEANAVYKAPANVPVPSHAEVEVTLEGLPGVKDPSAPDGVRKPGKLVLRKRIGLVPSEGYTFMKIVVNGVETLIAPEQPMYAEYDPTAFALFEAGVNGGLSCKLVLTHPQPGSWPCGPQDGTATEASVEFHFDAVNFALSRFCQNVDGRQVTRYTGGRLEITKVGNAGEPIEGSFSGNVFRQLNAVECNFQEYEFRVTFRFLRSS